MKQLNKITFIIFINLLLFSCTDGDKDAISVQDLLLGKWQTTAYTENGEVPSSFSSCDLLRTMEFLDNNELTFIDYSFDTDNNECEFNETYTYQYDVIDETHFKETRLDGSIIDSEILELNTSTLKVKSIYNDGSTVKIITFEKIN